MKRLDYAMGIGGLVAAAVLFSAPAHAAEQGRASEKFREEHAEVKKHLEHVREWNAGLLQKPAADQKKTAANIVQFFEQHIGPHAAWEEAKLYPVIDKLAGGGKHLFTASMRHEHAIVGRWIGELKAAQDKPDAAFVQKTDMLLGLITAHFECEEEVLLPLADKAMTAAQFEKAVGLEAGHGEKH